MIRGILIVSYCGSYWTHGRAENRTKVKSIDRDEGFETALQLQGTIVGGQTLQQRHQITARYQATEMLKKSHKENIRPRHEIFARMRQQCPNVDDYVHQAIAVGIDASEREKLRLMR